MLALTPYDVGSGHYPRLNHHVVLWRVPNKLKADTPRYRP